MSSTANGWPRAVVTMDAAGRAHVNLSGVVTSFEEGDAEAVRTSVIRFIVQRALVLGREIPASITEPDDHWEIIIHPDGMVTENPLAPQGPPQSGDTPQPRTVQEPVGPAAPVTTGYGDAPAAVGADGPPAPTPAADPTGQAAPVAPSPDPPSMPPSIPPSVPPAHPRVGPLPAPGSSLSHQALGDGRPPLDAAGPVDAPPAVTAPGEPREPAGGEDPVLPPGPLPHQGGALPAVADGSGARGCPAPAGPGSPGRPDGPDSRRVGADSTPAADADAVQALPTSDVPDWNTIAPAPALVGSPAPAPALVGSPAPAAPPASSVPAEAAGHSRPEEPVGPAHPAEPAPGAALPRHTGPDPGPMGGDQTPARTGLRGRMNRVGLKLRPSRSEQEERRDIAAVSAHWSGSRTIAVVNGKGGSMKTPTTVLLSAVFARHGGTGVVAFDSSPARGTLGWRTEQGPHGRTVVDLLPNIDRLLSPEAGPVEISAFTHQQSDGFDVLRSRPEVLADERPTTAEAFTRTHDVLSWYYRLVVIDSGNDEGSPAWRAMIGRADAIVVPTITRPEHAESARLLLSELSRCDAHSADLASRALVVVSQSSEAEPKPDRLVSRFQRIARDAIGIPYDPMMAGRPLRLGSLAPATQRAWLHAAARLAAGLG